MSEGVSCAMKSLKIGQRMKEGWKGCKSEIQPQRDVEGSWSRRERGYLIFIAEGCAREAEGEVRAFSPSLLSFPCLDKDVH